MNPNTVSLPATLELTIDLTDEQFFQLCKTNRDLRFERTARGELIIMPPTGRVVGWANFDHLMISSAMMPICPPYKIYHLK